MYNPFKKQPGDMYFQRRERVYGTLLCAGIVAAVVGHSLYVIIFA